MIIQLKVRPKATKLIEENREKIFVPLGWAKVS